MTGRFPASRGFRFAAVVLTPLLLAACASTGRPPRDAVMLAPVSQGTMDAERYAGVVDDGFRVPPVSLNMLNPQFRRQLVVDPTGEKPGTVVVDPRNHYLYLVQQDGMALRYGVGVGRQGMAWSGTARVAYKRQWPRWTPTQDMIARNPATYAKWADGMDGGENNPLGARALYLFQGGKDTLYRIHGTNEPWSIGKSMSSGCIRMINQDVMDLYRRIPRNAKVVVLPA